MRKSAKLIQPNAQRGIALIEALIAILLFSLGVLALAGMQASMTKNVTQSKLRGEASYLANQLIGQMWVDQANLANYAIASDACTVTSNTKCTSWLSSVATTLPDGGAEVTVNGSAVAVTVSWKLPGSDAVVNRLQLDANITN